MNKLRQIIPWWGKIIVKLLLARLPVGYSIWKRLRLFEHGSMEEPAKALEIFLSLARMSGILEETDHGIRFKVKPFEANFSILEIGPGDSLFSGVIAQSLGATKCWLIDADDFATKEMEPYIRLTELLRERGFRIHRWAQPDSVDSLMHDCGSTYLTQGVQSLKQLDSNSIDYCFSNAVLEHIPKQQFSEFVVEIARILKDDGVSSHRVDLKDHLVGALNNLRFSDSVWESKIFRTSGFYTNRIRFAEMMHLFEKASLEVEIAETNQWDELPTSRDCLHEQFRKFPDNDLLTRGFVVVLKKKVSEGKKQGA
jgi:predicted SAM-dependent methyltransferase